jgi:phosphinothricin acetyltransferase
MAGMEFRIASPADQVAVTAIYNHYVQETPYTFDVEAFSPEARAPWFGQFASRGRHQLLVAASGDAVLGYACSTAFKPKPAYASTVETTIYLAPHAVGQGIGPRLYGALFERLATEDIHRAIAGIVTPNPASMALHERLGFRPAGVLDEAGRKFGRWWTVEWLVKRMG